MTTKVAEEEFWKQRVGKEDSTLFRRIPSSDMREGRAVLINTLGVPTAVAKSLQYSSGLPLGKATVVGHLHAPFQTIEPSFVGVDRGDPMHAAVGLYEAPISENSSLTARVDTPRRAVFNTSPFTGALRFGFGSMPAHGDFANKSALFGNSGARGGGSGAVRCIKDFGGGIECTCPRCAPAKHVPAGAIRQLAGPGDKGGFGTHEMWQPMASIPLLDDKGGSWAAKENLANGKGTSLTLVKDSGMRSGGAGNKFGGLSRGNTGSGKAPNRPLAGVIASRAMAGSRPTSSSKSLFPRMRPYTSGGLTLPPPHQQQKVASQGTGQEKPDIWTAADDGTTYGGGEYLNMLEPYPQPPGTASRSNGQEGPNRWACPEDREAVMQRLARLEAQLQEERARRMAVEQVLMELRQQFNLN